MREMENRCLDYNGVSHRNFESEFYSVYERNCNLGVSLPYLNAVVASETLQCVQGQCGVLTSSWFNGSLS